MNIGELFCSTHVLSKASRCSYVNSLPFCCQWCLDPAALSGAGGCTFDWSACDGYEGTIQHGLLQLERTRSNGVESAAHIEHKKCVQLEIQINYGRLPAIKEKKMREIDVAVFERLFLSVCFNLAVTIKAIRSTQIW